MYRREGRKERMRKYMYRGNEGREDVYTIEGWRWGRLE